MTATARIEPRAERIPPKPTAHPEPAPVVFYDGDRIYFRPVEPEDEPQMRRWINDPANWRGLGTRGPLNACREREWIEQQSKSTTDVQFGIVVRQGHRLIGTAGLHRIDPIARKAEFGINLGDRAYQNKGFGTEATRLAIRYGFEELNLNRIGLWVLSSNPRAIRCYQKSGFVPEGCQRQAAFRNGQYVDAYAFGILREEWEGRRSESR